MARRKQEPKRAVEFASKGEILRFRELQALRSGLADKIAGIEGAVINRPFRMLGTAGMDVTIAKRAARAPIKSAEAALKRAQAATDRRRRDRRLEPRR